MASNVSRVVRHSIPRGTVEKRDITWPMQWLRDRILFRRKIQLPGRFKDEISDAPHNQEKPDLPPGPHDKLFANYYATRDGRREMKPPLLVVDQTGLPKQLSTGDVKPGESGGSAKAAIKFVTPGEGQKPNELVKNL